MGRMGRTWRALCVAVAVLGAAGARAGAPEPSVHTVRSGTVESTVDGRTLAGPVRLPYH